MVGSGLGEIKRGGERLFEQASQFHSGLYLHLVEDVGAVDLNGAHADAQLVGHHDTKTTNTFYLAKTVPPMVVIPVKLAHPDDAPPLSEA